MSEVGYEFPEGTQIIATEVELKLPSGEHIRLTGGKGTASTLKWELIEEYHDLFGDNTKVTEFMERHLKLEVDMTFLRPEDPEEGTHKMEVWTP